jgi:hypothetical protein
MLGANAETRNGGRTGDAAFVRAMGNGIVDHKTFFLVL